MKIENKKVSISTSKEIVEAIYTVKDIEQLIVNDLKEKGIKSIGPVRFSTKYLYVRDEWDVSHGTTTKFEGVTIEVERDIS